MAVLIGALILLSAGWLLWGWTVSEAYDIPWLRKFCAISFTSIAVLISAGLGAGVALTISKGRLRQDVRDFAAMLDQQLQQGRQQAARQALQSVLQPPDEWSTDSRDLLERMQAATQRLRGPAVDAGGKAESAAAQPAATAEHLSPSLTPTAVPRQAARSKPEPIRFQAPVRVPERTAMRRSDWQTPSQSR